MITQYFLQTFFGQCHRSASSGLADRHLHGQGSPATFKMTIEVIISSATSAGNVMKYQEALSPDQRKRLVLKEKTSLSELLRKRAANDNAYSDKNQPSHTHIRSQSRI